jgi:hypothetical protein
MVPLHLEQDLLQSGMRIWHGLKRALTIKQISQQLQEKFDVDEERADRDVLDLVNELSQQKLMQGGNDPLTSRRGDRQ